MEPLQMRVSASAPMRRAFAPFSVPLYEGLSHGDEHVTVWEPRSGKTIAGNAAPYRKNLQGWLIQHPGWEEKSDELKSSKRRNVARRQKAVSAAFAALCYQAGELPRVILNDALFWLRAAGAALIAPAEWTAEEDARLKEAIVHLAEEIFFCTGDQTFDSEYHWKRISAGFASRWSEVDVLRRARDLLSAGMQSYIAHPAGMPSSSPTFGSSLDAPALPSSPLSASLTFAERHLLAPREPRVTVWEPSTGRTVSGNAAPCRRNLQAWINAHPGWEPKGEEKLASSRRLKGRRPQFGAGDEVPGSPASAPQVNDALDALMLLSRCNSDARPSNIPSPMSFGGSTIHARSTSSLNPRDVRTESRSDMMEIDHQDSSDESDGNRLSGPPLLRASMPVTIPN